MKYMRFQYLLPWLVALSFSGCVSEAWSRCGDMQCQAPESVRSCSIDCRLPKPSRLIEVNNGPSIRGVADGDGMLVGTVFGKSGRVVLRLSRYNKDLALVNEADILSLPQTGRGELGNPHIIRGPGGGIYVAFRDHDISNANNPRYRLRVVRSTDDGVSWEYLNRNEGLIDESPVGLWEPFLYFDGKRQLRVVYAKERAEQLCTSQRGEKQDIVTKVSKNLGKTWTEERLVAGAGISRDGVPAVTRLTDGSYLAVFESWQDGTCGKANPNLLIRSMTSLDGIEWGARKVVFDPYRMGKKSIATWPSVSVLKDGRALVSFTSNFRNVGASSSDGGRPEAVRNFDLFVMASEPPETGATVTWDSDSLEAVSTYRKQGGHSNRFTSSIVLDDGRVVLFSGLPNRFLVLQKK